MLGLQCMNGKYDCLFYKEAGRSWCFHYKAYNKEKGCKLFIVCGKPLTYYIAVLLSVRQINRISVDFM